MEQISVVAYALVLGAVLGIFYDIFRIVRLLCGARNLGIFIHDVIYFLISGLVTFLFVLLFNFGESRFYILAGEALGWCLYHVSVGDMVYGWFKKIIQKAQAESSKKVFK